MSELKNQNNKKVNVYLRLTSVAIQMGVIITLFSLFGDYLDKKQKNTTAIWTIVLALIGVMSSMYLIIKEVKKISENEK